MLDISKNVLRVEFVQGTSNKNGVMYPYNRIDVYLPTIDGKEKKVSGFMKDDSRRLCGLEDPDPAKPRR